MKTNYLIFFCLFLVFIAFGRENRKIRSPHSENFILVYGSAVPKHSKAPADATPPRASIVSPMAGEFISCTPYDQKIKIAISDDDGIDWETLSILVNGYEYLWGDFQLTIENDSILCFTTIDPWEVFYDGDTVHVSLMDIADMHGNHMESTLNFNFFVDTSPPEIISFYPMDTSFSGAIPHQIQLNAFDCFSGIKNDVLITIGDFELTPSSPGVFVDSFAYEFRDDFAVNAVSIRIYPDNFDIDFPMNFWADTVILSVGVFDKAGICENNMQSRTFILTDLPSSGPEIRMVTLLDTDYISDPSPNFDFYIYDPDGVDFTTINYNVNSEFYDYEMIRDRLYIEDSRHFSLDIPNTFTNGQRIHFQLNIDDDLGNTSSINQTFICDLESPFVNIEDASSCNFGDSIVWFHAVDLISGINRSASNVKINGEIFGELMYNEFGHIDGIKSSSIASIVDNFNIYLHLEDKASLGPKNTIDTTWTVNINPESLMEKPIALKRNSINFPNPFNAKTRICFEDTPQYIHIYSIDGGYLTTLRPKSNQHFIDFEAQNLKSGYYIYQMHYSDREICKPMLLIK